MIPDAVPRMITVGLKTKAYVYVIVLRQILNLLSNPETGLSELFKCVVYTGNSCSNDPNALTKRFLTHCESYGWNREDYGLAVLFEFNDENHAPFMSPGMFYIIRMGVSIIFIS